MVRMAQTSSFVPDSWCHKRDVCAIICSELRLTIVFSYAESNVSKSQCLRSIEAFTFTVALRRDTPLKDPLQLIRLIREQGNREHYNPFFFRFSASSIQNFSTNGFRSLLTWISICSRWLIGSVPRCVPHFALSSVTNESLIPSF